VANLRSKDSSFLVLFKDELKREVFMVFRNDYPLWVLTGGVIDFGETPEKAALREAREETKFKVKLVKYLGKYEYPYKNTYLFEGRYLSGTYQPEFPGNIGKWFSVNRLPPDITNSTKRKIADAISFAGKPFVHRITNEIPLTSNLRLIMRHPLSAAAFIFKNFLRKSKE
jgi:8-oxo-dGTP pyrophosphatase MutT (NUDIX family)